MKKLFSSQVDLHKATGDLYPHMLAAYGHPKHAAAVLLKPYMKKAALIWGTQVDFPKTT